MIDLRKLEEAVAAVAASGPLRNEGDLVRALKAGTYTMPDLYAIAERVGLADRPGGRDRIQDGKEQYKRRVRSAVYAARDRGGMTRKGDDPAWIVEGSAERPRRALFVWLPGDPSQVELVLGAAADVLARVGEPVDLVVADPPWALGRGDTRSGYQRTYGRDTDKVVAGYVEVDPEEYADFSAQWIRAAAAAIRPGGYLAVITGAQQSARVQVAAEDAGLTYVNSIAVQRRFGVYCTRRFVHQHNRITLMTNGPLTSPARTFSRPDEMPRGRSGEVYAVDTWDDIPEYRRGGLLRYDNALHPKLVSRVVRSTTNRGDLVADPFLGSGTSAVACLTEGRRFFGGDLNHHSLRFTMGRILAEVAPELAREESWAA